MKKIVFIFVIIMIVNTYCFVIMNQLNEFNQANKELKKEFTQDEVLSNYLKDRKICDYGNYKEKSERKELNSNDIKTFC